MDELDSRVGLAEPNPDFVSWVSSHLVRRASAPPKLSSPSAERPVFLPKEILPYARKLEPSEIEEAVKQCVLASRAAKYMKR